MTNIVIGDVSPYTQATATLNQTVFMTNWTVNATSDVVVYQTPSGQAPNDATQILSPSQYTIALIGLSQQVQVTLNSGAGAGDIITITRDTPASFLNLYSNTNFVPSMLNNDFGLLTLIEQQNELVNQLIAPRYNYSAQIAPNLSFPNANIIIPILGANQTWVKNPANTAITTYNLPQSGIAPAAATYVTQANETATLANSFQLLGTTNQIGLTVGTNQLIVGIPNNPIMPGTAGMGIPGGTTAQRVVPSSNISFRYNSTLDSLEFYSNGGWHIISDDNDGIINPGTANQLAYYAASGNVLSGVGPLTNGQLLIGSTGLAPVASTLTQGAGITITNGAGSITIAGTGGTVVSISQGTGITCTPNPITGTGTIALTTPVALNIGGTNANLTAVNGGIVYSGASALAISAAGSASQILQSGGAGAPTWTTTTYPASNAINTIMYASSANVLGVITPVNSAVLISSAGGVPSMSQTLPTAVQGNITQLGAQSQALNMNSNLINSVSTPMVGTDAANKSYVDTVAAGLNPAESVQLATTANVPCTYNNGASGIGATITVTATGLLALDGVNVVIGKRYLFKDQSTGFQNGIFDCNVTGTGGLNPVFTRSADYNTPNDINTTGIIPVILGNTQAGFGYYETATITTIGTDALTFVRFGNLGTVTSVTFTGDGTVLSSTPSTAVTSSGTLTATIKNQNANIVLRGPTSGGAVAPTFRALVNGDLPSASQTSSGTFTPSFQNTGTSFGSVSYTTQSGEYTKIGNLVFFSVNLMVSAVTQGGASGNLLITNLPFTVGGTQGWFGAASSTFNTVTSAVGLFPVVGQVYAYLITNAGNGSVSHTELIAGTSLEASGFYFTS